MDNSVLLKKTVSGALFIILVAVVLLIILMVGLPKIGEIILLLTKGASKILGALLFCPYIEK